MNSLIKLTKTDDGDVCIEDQFWHLLTASGDTVRTACGYAIDGCSDNDGPRKNIQRGGITCDQCIATIKEYKEVRL